jgi:AefR-like transcriptional repressor, C-terminal domain
MTRLRILTLNVENLEGDDRRTKAINQELRQIAPDLVSFQEVISRSDRNQLDELLAGTELHGTHQADAMSYAPPYYEQAPARMLAAFTECFGRLHDRGLLHVHEPALAAEHFAFLIVGRCIDQALFYGGPQVLAGVDPQRYVAAGVRVFLAGYRPRGAAGER